jgi:hypothetical protein
MNNKFLVYKDSIFYSTHGEISAQVVYDAYIRDQIVDSFKLTGFKDNGESISSIISMKEVYLNECYIAKISGAGMQSYDLVVYNKQRFMDANGKPLHIEDIKVNTLLLSLNGMLQADFVELSKDNSNNIEMPAKFYLIECQNMPNMYTNNIIVLPYSETEDKINFFIK